MTFLFYLILLLNIIFFTKKNSGQFINSKTIFSFLWCLSAGCSSLGIFGLYKPSMQVHFFCITVIIVFNLVYDLLFFYTQKHKKIIKKYTKYEIRIKLLVFLNVVGWVFLVPILRRSILIILNSGFNALRVYAYDSTFGLATTSQLMIAQVIIEPLFSFTGLVSAYNILQKDKYIYFFIVSIISISLYTIAFAGRGLMVSFILYLLILFFVLKFEKIDVLKEYILKKRSTKVILIFFMFCIIFIVLTNLRSWSSNGNNVFKEVYLYFVGSFTFLDRLLISIDSLNTNLLYGKATFGFVYNWLSILLTMIGFPYRGSDFLITTVTAIPKYISNDRMFNALGTMIYPFYRDFRYVGIIFGIIFFGFLVFFLENRFKKDNNIRNLFFYCFVLNLIINSTKNYYLLFPAYGTFIALVILFTKKCKVKEGK